MVHVSTKVSGRRLSRGQRLSGAVIEPLISIRLRDQRRDYQPGDLLRAAYQVDAPEESPLAAVEASVLWYTEGKGDEDMAVHFFERRQAADITEGDLRQQWEFETTLPKSPLTYDGVTVKIRWCVRVRVFLERGKEVSADLPFRLGRVPRARKITVVEPEHAEKPAKGAEPETEQPKTTSDDKPSE
jgi:hypothetical protein